MVNVTVPPFTVPAALVTVADRFTDCTPALKVKAASTEAVVAAAALIVNEWVASVDEEKFAVPLYTAWME
jgi:hypothetical protein